VAFAAQQERQSQMSALKVAVLGAGNWGTTLAHLSAIAGCTVRLWLRNAAVADEIREQRRNSRYTGDTALSLAIEPTTDLSYALHGARLVLAVIPSSAARSVIRELGPMILGSQVFVHATKGLEMDTGKRVSQMVREETAIRKLGVLSGPNIAPEILRGLPSATVVASEYPEVIAVAQRALTSPRFRVYANDDVVGVELGGALKNIIAIASGIVSGLALGENTRSLLMTRGLAEMGRFATKHGARALTLAGLSGMGDLVVTCSSQHSRNYRVGVGLAQGKPLVSILRELGMVAEGVRTTQIVHDLAKREGIDMPIAAALARVLAGELDVHRALDELMRLPARADIDGDLIALR
jgi:glycerol-3-phosphate dehydrogenase (NAD(P)+)